MNRIGRQGNRMTLRGMPIFLAAALLVGANPAAAADTIVRVSGDSVPSDCGAAKSANGGSDLTGSLVGCLAVFVDRGNCGERNGFAFSTELGREEFEGTLDGKPIMFDTSYVFEAIWPAGSCPTPAPESEIVGGCTHYISGEGIQGVIRFWDVIPTVGQGATNFLYDGVLTISDGKTAAIAPIVPPHDDVALTDVAMVQGSPGPQSMAC